MGQPPPADLAELIVIRHGESTANVAFAQAAATGAIDAAVTGRDADVELSPLGRQQAACLGRWLSARPTALRPDVVVCSPYRRAVHTWQIAAARLHAPFPPAEIDDRLVDRLMGDFELLTRRAVDARHPAEASRRHSEGEFAYRPPNGESFADIADRLAAFLADQRKAHAGGRVLVVAHDAVVLTLRHLIEGRPFEELASEPGAALASITTFEAVPPAPLTLTTYNSTTHLTP